MKTVTLSAPLADAICDYLHLVCLTRPDSTPLAAFLRDQLKMDGARHGVYRAEESANNLAVSIVKLTP